MADTPSNISNHDFDFKPQGFILGLQTLFIAMGALVLVPLLSGLDTNVALFTAGVGTLIFQVITKGKVPAFLGSSFSFVPVTIFSMQTFGFSGTLFGLAMGGVVYFLMSLLVTIRGVDYINKILPPIVTGPVIMGIGLVLSPVAANMAMGKSGNGELQLIHEPTALIIAFTALVATIGFRLFAKGKMKLIPMLVGVLAGYLVSLFFGVVDFTPVIEAQWFSMPHFSTPTVNWQAALLVLPIAAVSAIEHIGDIAAISAVANKDFVKSPGLDKTLFGNGVSAMFASLLGGPPNTTYSEVTASIALTKVYNPAVMTWTSIIAIGLAFIGKVGALLQTIPAPVMGGILMLLFGAIAVTGLNLLVNSKTDLMEPRNMSIVGLIMVVPIGGLTIGSTSFALSGIGLGGIVGVLMHLILPHSNEPSAQAA